MTSGYSYSTGNRCVVISCGIYLIYVDFKFAGDVRWVHGIGQPYVQYTGTLYTFREAKAKEKQKLLWIQRNEAIVDKAAEVCWARVVEAMRSFRVFVSAELQRRQTADKLVSQQLFLAKTFLLLGVQSILNMRDEGSGLVFCVNPSGSLILAKLKNTFSLAG